ncbi:MAG: tripartite tricarboxylate transporter substrate binding protein [Pseudomonadota bacterium]
MDMGPRRAVTFAAAALAAACAPPVFAQGDAAKFPQRTLRIVMPFPPQGPTDILGRLIATHLAERVGQQVIVDNRPGGAGVIGAMVAAKAAPDGHTMLLGGITTHGVAPFVHRNLPYDPLKDFIPVTQTTLSPLLLMVGTATPVRSVKEYIALARSKPGGVTYASSGPGGSGHLAGALFEHVAGVDLLHIPYRGAPPALIDLMAGQVQSMFGTMLAAVPHVRSGKIRAIAVTGPRRSEAVPEVLTFAESGLPAYDASSWNGIMVPAGTPMPIVDRLYREISAIVKAPGVLDRLASDGPLPVGNTPQEFAAFIRAEQAKWAKVVKQAKIAIE